MGSARALPSFRVTLLYIQPEIFKGQDVNWKKENIHTVSANCSL